MAETIAYASGLAADAGVRREPNEDAAYAGRRLFAVADGFGSIGLGGEVASAAVIDTLRVGDRYLLCTDGLLVLDARNIHHLLGAVEDPRRAAARLVEEVTAAGGPDNVACVVVDVRAATPAGGPGAG